jgi:hypothetical protein
VSRFNGFLLAAMLAFASGIAIAQTNLPVSKDFGDALIQGIYGEVSHSGSVSLLDDDAAIIAFHVSFDAAPASSRPIHVAAPRLASLSVPQPGSELPVPLAQNQFARKTNAREVRRMLVTAEYQPEPLSPTASSSSPFSFQSQRPDPLFGFAIQNNLFDDGALIGSQAVQLPMTMQVGNLHLEARVGASAQLGAADRESEENLPAFIAPYTSVSRSSLNAAFAVPVTPRLMLGFGYDTEHLLGGYGAPGLDSLDARNDMYSGRLTFLLPHFSSALSLSAQQYRYQDNLLPTDAYTQLRESLDLTIKF